MRRNKLWNFYQITAQDVDGDLVLQKVNAPTPIVAAEFFLSQFAPEWEMQIRRVELVKE